VTVSTRERSQTIFEWVIMLACSALLAFHTLPRAWRTLNTDFPNYYLAAQLAHQGYDTSQAYDWRWLQREKDHRQIDQPIIALAPITPFSTFFVYPLTSLPPLHAKHLWTLLQLTLIPPILLALHSLTGQPLRRIALFTVLCIPLHRNLIYGQFYILLLALIVAACWAYSKGHRALSGSLIAIATMTKIFPAIFLLYFLRKKSWPALISAFITLAAASALSIWVFGWSIHRHYLQVILPWTLRGEALPPYALASASISTLLHSLFIAEPQWNPHPWHNLPLLAATLAPVLQMLILAPAILLLRPTSDRTLIPLEWSALITATLTISTVPASYNFTLLILPITVLYHHLARRNYPLALAAIALYLAIGYPNWHPSHTLFAPRLDCLIALTALCCWALHSASPSTSISRPWAIALASLTLISAAFAVHHQQGLYSDYDYRIPTPPDTLLSAAPQGASSIQLTSTGYHLSPAQQGDQLTFAQTPAGPWVEQVAATSRIIPPPGLNAPAIEDAHSPTLLPNGKGIAFIRSQQGRGRLYSQLSSTPLTPANVNVLEAATLPDGTFLIAATTGQTPAAIYSLTLNSAITSLNLGESRYPALSPDGHWLAFSRFQAGAWNLWLQNRTTLATQRVTNAACNQTEPSWEPDSHTLLYASDCGRALGLTAICRRRVIP
jgi:hypothetical protein